MPIYEYACGKCDHEFEVEQRISDPPIKTCPKCRSRKVKKLISRTSFVLKGSGWYSDLYSSPTKSESKKEGGSEGDGASSDAKETKPAKSESASGDGEKKKSKAKGKSKAA